MPNTENQIAEEVRSYGTKITTQGAALLADCLLKGEMLQITEAAAGDGGGAYYEPTVDQQELKNEKWRGLIASAQLSPTTPNMIDVKIVIEDMVGGFTIREMALYADDGTEEGLMLAVCNTPDTEKVAISQGVSGKLTMMMHIVVADASILEFTINPSLDTVSRQEMEAALLDHDTSDTSHADIRQLALNSAQMDQVFTKEETTEALEGAIAAHNSDGTAHASLHVMVTGIDSRLKTLELKYGTNVTGNSFEVTFTNLTGLVVTGVWNETYARVEF